MWRAVKWWDVTCCQVMRCDVLSSDELYVTWCVVMCHLFLRGLVWCDLVCVILCYSRVYSWYVVASFAILLCYITRTRICQLTHITFCRPLGICRATLQKTWTAGDPPPTTTPSPRILQAASNCRRWDDRDWTSCKEKHFRKFTSLLASKYIIPWLTFFFPQIT